MEITYYNNYKELWKEMYFIVAGFILPATKIN